MRMPPEDGGTGAIVVGVFGGGVVPGVVLLGAPVFRGQQLV